MLTVWTSRISFKDADTLNVTRKSGCEWLAPSWPLLRRMLEIKQEGRSPTEAEWKDYAKRYLSEMGVSHRENRALWDELLTRERVVLVCYCTNPLRCHRTILARILASLGAKYCGEIQGT